MRSVVHGAVPQRLPNIWQSLMLGTLWQFWQPLQKQGKNRSFQGSWLSLSPKAANPEDWQPLKESPSARATITATLRPVHAVYRPSKPSTKAANVLAAFDAWHSSALLAAFAKTRQKPLISGSLATPKPRRLPSLSVGSLRRNHRVCSRNGHCHTPFPFHRAIPQRWPTCWPSLSVGNLWQSWPPLQKQGKNRTFRGSGAVQDPIDGQTLSVGHLWTNHRICSGNDHCQPPLPFILRDAPRAANVLAAFDAWHSSALLAAFAKTRQKPLISGSLATPKRRRLPSLSVGSLRRNHGVYSRNDHCHTPCRSSRTRSWAPHRGRYCRRQVSISTRAFPRYGKSNLTIFL
jgi:hypothetical protein